jgi:hypothetical protein
MHTRSRDKAGKVGLYVATDVEDLMEHDLMTEKLNKLRTMLQQNAPDVTLRVLNTGMETTTQIVKEAFGVNLREEAELLVDVQLAACAPMGFVGTSSSSFSMQIERLRKEGTSCSFIT